MFVLLQPTEEGERQAAVTRHRRQRLTGAGHRVATEEQKRPSGLSENSSDIRFLLPQRIFFFPFLLLFFFQDIDISGHRWCIAGSDNIFKTPA